MDGPRSGSGLAHVGVKGMRWGVRKKSSRPKPDASEDSVRAKASKAVLKKHGVSALSNQDLQHLTNRLELEKKISSLNPKRGAAGRKFTRELLLEIGKSEARRAILGASAAGVASAFALRNKTGNGPVK